MDEQSIFLQALEQPAGQIRDRWLDDTCAGDADLRARIDALLARDAQMGSFLENPPSAFDGTIIGQVDVDLAASMEAGLTAALGTGEAVILGDAGHSVLKSLGKSINVPHVMLRESKAEGPDPIVRPQSYEMSNGTSDSRYQLQGEIARGGMGAIIKGRDTDLGRDLAIKVLLDSHKDKPEVIQRFIEEAQIGGQMQHPGIAPIYELGQFKDKRPFFSMKLVKGETLAKLLARRKDQTEDRGRFLGIFEQVCQTMAYAHSRGVIHRDLKPANVMVGAFGEVQVMDWGLAKVLSVGGIADEKEARDTQVDKSIIQTLRSQPGSDAPGTFGTLGSQTQMGSVMGTPAYMPPEQALGEIDNLDERADVFGLGAILCEILTGKPPYVGEDGTQVYRMASRGKLQDAFSRLDGCGADADLITLTKHCLELEPVDRPRDAGVLAERISDYLESVETKLRQSEIERATEAARAEEALNTAREQEVAAQAERRARKLQLSLAAGTVAVLIAAGIATTWVAVAQSQLRQDAMIAEREANAAREKAESARHLESEQRRLAEEQRSRAEQEEALAKSAKQQAELERMHSLNMLADMQTERGFRAGKEGQPAEAALWFTHAALLTPHDPDRQMANHRRAETWGSQAMKPVALLKVSDARITHFAFDREGSRALTISGGRLRVWDWRNEIVFPWTDSFNDVSDAEWSPDGNVLAIGRNSHFVQLVDSSTGNVLSSFDNAETAMVLAWAPDGTRLVTAGSHVQIWNVTDTPVRESDWPHPKPVYGVNFNRSGSRLVTACQDNLARVFATQDATASAPLSSPVDHKPVQYRRFATPVFCDNDRRLVTFSSSRMPALWDAESGSPVETPWTHFGYTVDRCLSVGPDHQWVVAGGARGCWLFTTDGKSVELQHPNHVDNAVFTSDGKSVLTTGYDGTARHFPLEKLDSDSPAAGYPQSLPQQGTFASGYVTPNGECCAIHTDYGVVFWERQASSDLSRTLHWQGQLWLPRFSFDGELVTPGARHSYSSTWWGQKTTLSVSRVSDGQPAGPAIALEGKLVDSCVCSNSRLVAAACDTESDGLLTIYDIASGRPVLDSLQLAARPRSIDSHPERAQIAVLSQDGTLQVFDTQTGSLQFESEHARESSYDCLTTRFSPDGGSLIVVMNEAVYVREPQSGRLRFEPIRSSTNVGVCRSIAFFPTAVF